MSEQPSTVTAIAAPVRERKSLIALNIAHSLVTGEKLFGHFEVAKKPERVLYLCPEVSLGPFVDRLRKIGLEDWVGNRFFYRTLSAEGHLRLDDPIFQEALPGSVVFLDTAIRFLDGGTNVQAARGETARRPRQDQLRTALMTLPCTSVRRKSRPWKR